MSWTLLTQAGLQLIIIITNYTVSFLGGLRVDIDTSEKPIMTNLKDLLLKCLQVNFLFSVDSSLVFIYVHPCPTSGGQHWALFWGGLMLSMTQRKSSFRRHKSSGSNPDDHVSSGKLQRRVTLFVLFYFTTRPPSYHAVFTGNQTHNLSPHLSGPSLCLTSQFCRRGLCFALRPHWLARRDAPRCFAALSCRNSPRRCPIASWTTPSSAATEWTGPSWSSWSAAWSCRCRRRPRWPTPEWRPRFPRWARPAACA